MVTVVIYTYTTSRSLSLSHISEHLMNYTYDNILNCKLAGVFRTQARLSTVERARAHGCQVDKDKYHT